MPKSYFSNPHARTRIIAPGLIALLFCVTVPALLTGCERNLISGKVLDVKGEPLPGVAVEVRQSGFQALTDGLGQYHVPYKPGPQTVYFSKSGYTPGILQLAVEKARPVDATSVSLWPLPEGKGTFLFENFRYVRTDFVKPDPFRRKKDDSVVYGSLRASGARISNQNPIILCYRMLPFDAKLTRLELSEVEPELGQRMDKALKAWVPVEDIAATSETIDEPERNLFRIKPAKPLDCGSYAVHWGAVYGTKTHDERMFFFTIFDPKAPPPDLEKKDTKPGAKPDAKGEAKPEKPKAEQKAPAVSAPSNGEDFEG